MHRSVSPLVIIGIVCCWANNAVADAEARYIANMGVMIEQGETRVLFDPLFKNHFDTYDPVPADVEAALLAGEEPWSGVDAVFISHYHGDHIDPETMLSLLRAQPAIRLFAPEQAAVALRELVDEQDDEVLERIKGLALIHGEPAVEIELDSLLIEAIRVPHAGWPNRHTHIENLVFRVTLDDDTTVMHLGDADTVDEHYAVQAAHWEKRHTHFAMPPYWFFLSGEGREILKTRIRADHAIGMHVPTEVPDDASARSPELQDVDLFTRPGETRAIGVAE